MRMKNNTGITIIALVITIIIVLILAVVAISQIFNESGMFSKAMVAGEKYNEAAKKEVDVVNQILAKVEPENSSSINSNELKIILNELKTELISSMYPIGSIYITTNEENPKELFGGEWERYAQGRTLIGAGEETDSRGEKMKFLIDEMGGEYKHQLTESELASHSHIAASKTGKTGWQGTSSWSYLTNDAGSYVKSENPETQIAGGDTPHNNLQPYIVTYMWKRIN